MRSGSAVLTTIILAVAAAVTGGCGTSAVFPFDKQTVWQAARGEAIVWHPTLIDDNRFCVKAAIANTTGAEVRYDLEVTKDMNPFATRPSTRVYVYMRQTRPRRVNFPQMERDFLIKVAERLTERPGPPGE